LPLRPDFQQGDFADRSPANVAGEAPVGPDRPAGQIFLSSKEHGISCGESTRIWNAPAATLSSGLIGWKADEHFLTEI